MKNQATHQKTLDMNHHEKTPIKRRELMKHSSLVAGVALLGGALARHQPAGAQPGGGDDLLTAAETATAAEPAPAPGIIGAAGTFVATASDVDLLSFAITLEYLLHDLYLRVAAANTPATERRSYIPGRLGALIPTLRDNKAAHIVSLTSAISAAEAEAPARGAFNFPADIFLSPTGFAQFAATMEEIAAGAYLSTLPQFQDQQTRAFAASLYGNATRHASLVRLLAGYEFAPHYFENAYSIAQTRQMIAPFIA